jgi:cysteine desulfurase
VQALGKIPLDINELGVDMLTLSAHKCGGPIGAACLVSKKNVPLLPLIKGGGQEQSFRAGTENITAIIGFGMAAELGEDNINQLLKLQPLRNEMEATLMNYGAKIIGKESPRLPNTSCIMMPTVNSETQLINFDLAGFSLSAGSACSSGRINISHVLTAMGYTDQEAATAIRVSLGIETTKMEIDKFIEKWQEIYQRLASNNNLENKLSA